MQQVGAVLGGEVLLKSTIISTGLERIQIQVVLSTPEGKLFHLLSVDRR